VLTNAHAATGVEVVTITRLGGEGDERLAFFAKLAKLCWFYGIDGHDESLS
jgi:hypothetical protein